MPRRKQTLRRRLLRLVLWAVTVAIVVTAGVAYFMRDEITRLMAVNTLFREDRIVANFSGMDTLFHHRVLDPGEGPPSPLPEAAPIGLPDTYADWAEARSVTGIVVLRDGAIVHEDYRLGTGRDDLRISWSMAKSYLSALFGILEAEGAFSSLDSPVERYAPQLAGSGYEGASIRNVLQMASGVRFNEDYFDYNSDINRMGRLLALGGSMDGFAASFDMRDWEPGTQWRYISTDTHVIGMTIRGATGRDIPELMEERLIAPLGLEQAPYYITDSYGVAFVLGGLNLTTRDYARFGQMMLQEGEWQGRQVVPADWVRRSTEPTAPTLPGQIGYGYQWWVPEDAVEGEFLARGIYGQYIYVNRPAATVIAVNSADLGFRELGVWEETLAMFRAIAAAPRGL